MLSFLLTSLSLSIFWDSLGNGSSIALTWSSSASPGPLRICCTAPQCQHFSLLEDLQTHLDVILGRALGVPADAGIRADGPRGLFQPQRAVKMHEIQEMPSPKGLQVPSVPDCLL